MSSSKSSLSPTPRANVRRRATGLHPLNRSDPEVSLAKVKKEPPADEIKVTLFFCLIKPHKFLMYYANIVPEVITDTPSNGYILEQSEIAELYTV